MTPEKAMLFYGFAGGAIIVSVVSVLWHARKGNLVRDARLWWQWHSTKALIALGLIPTIWFELPPDLKEAIPSSWMRTIAIVIMVVGIASRMKVQKPKGDDDDKA